MERARLEALRSEAFADDLEIEDVMLEWNEAAARAFFETGGVTRPKQAGEGDNGENGEQVFDDVITGDVVALGGVWAKVEQQINAPHLVPFACESMVSTPPGLGSQSSLGTLRWLMMQIGIGQDSLLLADPGPRPRQLVQWLCAMLGREIEWVGITRDSAHRTAQLNQLSNEKRAQGLPLNSKCVVPECSRLRCSHRVRPEAAARDDAWDRSA